MAKEDAPSDLFERIRGIASTMLGDRQRVDESTSGLVDTAARSLASTLERWGRKPNLRRLVGGVREDALTSPGEPVDLSVSLGVSKRLGTRARFFVGDVMANEVEIGESDELYTVITAPEPGLYTLRVELSGGDRIAVLDLGGQRTLQVVSARPVALVHAELFLPSSGDGAMDDAACDALRALEDRFELAYFDIDEQDRYAQIFEEIERRALPRGAILVHSAKDSELNALGVDFVEMFASTAIRRLRSRGVPVTTMLTRQYRKGVRNRAEQVQVLTLEEARGRVESGASAEVAQAAQMLADRAAADPLTWRLDQTTASRLVAGNAFHAELDNRAARERIFEVIEGANSSIHVQLYMVRPSRFTELLIVHLIRRARAGVKVRFMVDALYSEEEVLGRVNASMQSLKDEPNINVLAVEPIESREQVTLSRLKKRDHRKLLIVDGRRAFVSGRNASDEYYTGFDEVPVHDQTRHESIPWLDAHVEVSGPLVKEVQEAFLDTWARQGGPLIARDVSVLPALEPCGDASGRLVVHRGFADTNGLAMYEAMFDAARSHVFIVNDFPFVAAIERAIHRLLARGVRVRLLTGNAAARRADGTFFPAPLHRTLFEYMVKAKLEPLIEAGVEAYELVPPCSTMVVARGGFIRPYVHAKLVSVDGLVTSIGSANLDATASFWESEANVVVQDPEFSRGVEATLESLIERSVRLDLDSTYWRRERAQRAVVATLWPGTLYS